ncbi:MAG: hypothetical protein LBS60_07975 [Deltaproteobacteria bacterium]|jgi:hypothetical protein|nr:hypothetical protein [Deltaproteobacteria bacterium]
MSQSNIKMFNTVGPCVPGEHYTLPVLSRLPEDDINQMIDGKFYFVLHAPRQSGKTTYLKLLTNKINSDGNYYALFCSLASLSNITDRSEAVTTIFDQINQGMSNSQISLIKNKADTYNSLPGISSPSRKIRIILSNLCEDLDKDLIVFFDEADCLAEDGLITFLTQLRDGYIDRSEPGNKFPRSIALVGMRDIRDYLRHVRPDSASKNLASPFNIKKEAFTLANFTRSEIGTLYRQHTIASGQVFDDSAIDRAWYWSEGQPWLVNALAYEIVVKILQNDYQATIDVKLMDQAAEALIERRDTHIDSLLERLKDPMVAKVINGVIAGESLKGSIYIDDRKYCLDLGLVAKDADNNLRLANPIYQEVISRLLTDPLQEILKTSTEIFTWNDGQIVFISEILKKYQDFWRKNAFSFPLRINEPQIASFKNKIDSLGDKAVILEILTLVSRKYDEAAYSIILLAFLQRVASGGARVDRKFAEGRGAAFLRVSFKERAYLIECKISGRSTVEQSVSQLAGNLDTEGEKEGWLVFFDRDRTKKWEDKIYWDTQEFEGKTIHVIGC